MATAQSPAPHYVEDGSQSALLGVQSPGYTGPLEFYLEV